MRPESTRKAFTLIELLVVIAIIAILAAILFPVFATAREKARQSACLTNEKQLGLAFMQYQQDYDEILPPAQINATGTYNWDSLFWHDLIYPYVKSVVFFNCPSLSGTGAVGPVTTTWIDNAAWPGAFHIGVDSTHNPSYGVNNNYFNGNSDTSGSYKGQGCSAPFYGKFGLQMAQIRLPSDTILMTEYVSTGQPLSRAPWGLDPGLTATPVPGAPTWTNPGTIANQVYRHLGTTNVLFCDGHAKNMTQPAILATHAPTSGTITTPIYYMFTVQQD
jgi:prepilin-type N-terminal cleavage/methylation domain-containing protein/prepilin-type processing-associated H-X9-DG protein